MAQLACGIDIGGSGIKCAIVDLEAGELVTESIRLLTPQPATPEAVAAVCKELIKLHNVPVDMPVGVAVPAPVVNGNIAFMANLDQSWVNIAVNEILSEALGRPVFTVNDADAAGLAETRYGAAAGVKGTVILTTLGTGIGSAIVVDGVLVPNTELGHLEIDGFDAETRASAGQKTAQNLDWEEWAQRLQRYYSHVEMLFAPDLFVVGGGVSANHDRFMPLLNLKTPMVPAKLLNPAGIVGAAMWAQSRSAQ